MGPYGIRHLGEQLTDLVSSQVKELKVTMYVRLKCYLLPALAENSGIQQGCITQLAHESWQGRGVQRQPQKAQKLVELIAYKFEPYACKFLNR